MSARTAAREADPSRARILATAGELIARYGIEGMSLQMLADVLFYPAIAEDDLAREILGTDPRAPRAIRARKEELTALLRGAFGA